LENEIITLGHGSGAGLTRELISDILKPTFDLLSLEDSVQIDENIVITTDSYVVNPLFFPGGNIGKLAVTGTVNDLAMKGARPAFLMMAFIIEEGLPLKDFRKIVSSIAKAAKESQVKIVAGDTKVVEKNRGDGIFITSSGVGYLPKGMYLGTDRIKPGNKILINGSIGDHAISVINARNNLGLEPAPKSDCASLHDLVIKITETGKVNFLRDATRGGVAAIMNEVVQETGYGIIINEKNLPVKENIEAVCELLGLDPLYLANEGKLTVFASDDHEDILRIMKKQETGKDSALIGEVTDEFTGVFLRTEIGSLRPILMIDSDPLPRIC